MKVRVKKLVEEAVIPIRAHFDDAGMDLTAVSYKYDEEMDCHIYGTGLAMEIPNHNVGLIFPRSSNRKTDAYMGNHVGVVDAGYRGEIMVSFKNRDKDNVTSPYNVGDRIAQLIIMEYPHVIFEEADELSKTDRGIKGHGSSGN